MPTEKRERQRQGQQARREYLMAQRKRARLRRQVITVVVMVAIVLGLGLLVTARDGGDDQAADDTPPTTLARVKPVATDEAITGDTPCPPADGSAEATYKFEKPPPMCIDAAKTYVAKLETSEGDVEITLDTQKTPKTANNFVVLSRYHYYDGTALFRTNTGIAIIQGGSPHTQGNDDSGPGYTIEDEGSGFTYTEGDFVMARTQAPNSASAQFFFAAGPETAQLNADGSYVVFGKVTKGLNVVKKILALHKDDPAAGSPGEGKPGELVTIDEIEIIER